METFSTVLSPSVTVTVGMWASWNAFLPFFFYKISAYSSGPQCPCSQASCPAFVTCSTKSGEKAWTDLSHDACRCWCQIQSAHIWVCSLPFLSLNSVFSFCSVCPVSPTATVCDVSSGTHHVINPSRPSPAFCTASDKSWAWRPGNKASPQYSIANIICEP